MFKIITTTGSRPEAWELCKQWMRKQTAKPDAWIIVDDCEQQSLLTGIDVPTLVVRPKPLWQPGENTQARNLLAALENVREGDKVVFIEDDDYYAPRYLENVGAWLDRFHLVGERNATYYHVGQRVWRNCGNVRHASLCATAMSGRVALTKLKDICKTKKKFIDMELWRKTPGKLFDTNLTVGIKGLPGRPGIGAGHRMVGNRDDDMKHLEKLIGADVCHYKRYYQQ